MARPNKSKKAELERRYTAAVTIQGDGPIRGSNPILKEIPEDQLTEEELKKKVALALDPFATAIDPLLTIPDKNTKTLMYNIVKAQIDLCLQAGDVTGAWNAYNMYIGIQEGYKCQLAGFKRDHQNGDAIYIGAHCFVGAFRDGFKWLYEPFFQKKGDGKPGKAHFRKAYQVYPNHPTIKRPDGSNIYKPDGVDGQQPTPEVGGFAKNERIDPPWEITYYANINPKGKFLKYLSNRDLVEEVIRQACTHGVGGCRSAGFGMNSVKKLEFHDGVYAPRGMDVEEELAQAQAA